MTAVLASDRLRSKLDLVAAAVERTLFRLWSHPELPALFPGYLVTMHGVIRASVPLMEVARRELRRSGGAADFAALNTYLERHIEEERDHDKWLLQDLASLGIDPEVVFDRHPTATVARLVGSQYYWIFHHHPVALVGYIAVLEGNAPSPELISALERRGIPRRALRTLEEHADLDPGHRDELDRVVDGLPEGFEGLIGTSALATVDSLAVAVDELIAREGRTC